MLAILQIRANLKDLLLLPRARAINNTSGGIGKNDASENANINSAMEPYGVSAQLNIQSYNILIEVNILGDKNNSIKNLYHCHQW